MAYRIIGCGALNRGDDAAGLLVVRRLRELGIGAYEHSGDGVSLIEHWQGLDAIILIDAVVTGARPGAVTVWDGWKSPIRASRRSSTHAFGVAEAVKLARVLGRMPMRLLICGIEGCKFDLGCRPSPEVVKGAEQLAQRLAYAAAASSCKKIICL
jgi:hydrogenase maturation protease